MPLPIEVNHVLGRRSLTLAYRDVDTPITIGRGRDCDVQIPSVAVGAHHCMLFVHEGQWLLQESPNAIVTVNGKQIAGPMALQIGDVIGVGPGEKAPSIQIDPAGAATGKTGPAVEASSTGAPADPTGPAVIGAAARGKVRPPRPTPIAGDAPPQLSAPKARPARPEPIYEQQPETGEYAPANETTAFEPAEPDGDTIDFGQLAAAEAGSTYRRRRPKQDSGAAGMIAILVVVVVVLGALILWAWQRHEAMLAALPHDQPPVPPVAVIPTTMPEGIADHSGDAGSSIFDVPNQHPHPAAPPVPLAPATPPATPPSPPTDTGAPAAPSAPPAESPTTAPSDAGNTPDDDTDADWQTVRAAHIGPDQSDALVKYDSYRQANLGKHTKELAQFENDALEQLWWQRVLQLFNKRADLDKQIAKQKQDLAQQPADNFKKQMQADLAAMKQKRDNADQELTGKYGYTLPTPPDLDDSDAVAQQDAKRDPDMFARWKKSTLIWIREHNGRTPWADE